LTELLVWRQTGTDIIFITARFAHVNLL